MTSSMLEPPVDPEEKKLLGSRLLDGITGRLTNVGQSIVEASQDDPDTWTDDMIRLGLGGAKNVGNVLNAPGIKQALQALGAPAWVVGKGLGWSLEKAGVDPRYGQIVGEVGEWFIPFYGAGKLVKKAKGLATALNTASDLRPRSVGAAGRGPLPPSSGDIQSIENALNPERLDRIKNLKDNLISQVNQNRVDSLNPTLSLKTRMDLAMAQRHSGYEVGGRFRYKQFKAHQKNMDEQGRSWLGIFQAGFTGGGASRAVPFKQYRSVHKARLLEEFGPTLRAMGLNEDSLQIHHIAALKPIMGVFDGLTMNSRIYREVSDTILKEIPGLGLGDMLGNLKPVVGSTSDIGTPHYLVHKFYNSKLGKRGELFFTDKVLKNMEISRPYRLRKAKEVGQIIKESEEIVSQAQKVYQTLYTDVPLDQVIDVMSQMDEFGYVKLINRDYQVDKVPQIVEAIVNDIEINGFPTRLGPAWWQEGRKIRKRLIKKPKKN